MTVNEWCKSDRVEMTPLPPQPEMKTVSEWLKEAASKTFQPNPLLPVGCLFLHDKKIFRKITETTAEQVETMTLKIPFPKPDGKKRPKDENTFLLLRSSLDDDYTTTHLGCKGWKKEFEIKDSLDKRYSAFRCYYEKQSTTKGTLVEGGAGDFYVKSKRRDTKPKGQLVPEGEWIDSNGGSAAQVTPKPPLSSQEKEFWTVGGFHDERN